LDLPEDRAVIAPSEIQVGNGETYDLDVLPSAAGDLRLDVTDAVRRLLESMPVRVR
jgi:hypothetical protein